MANIPAHHSSRAEYRLAIRADNADLRLTPRAKELGCVSAERVAALEAVVQRMDAGRQILQNNAMTPDEWVRTLDVNVRRDGMRRR